MIEKQCYFKEKIMFINSLKILSNCAILLHILNKSDLHCFYDSNMNLKSQYLCIFSVLFIFQLRILVNSITSLVNTFVPSGKLMKMVDQKLVRNN